MKPITTRSPRAWAAVLLVFAALGLAACGGNSSNPTSQSSGGSSTPAASSPSTSTQSSSSNSIPQGPNAGDADSDNHGGPSDGDGNL